ncbi:hypothetical protein BU15DRAFT_52920 [Melanogaster broomeanus]|nr:hypothetical protein BU15DRAFT_52920 [Melanogaster broomeanus]
MPAEITSLPPNSDADPQDIDHARLYYPRKACFYRCRFDLNGSPCNMWIIGERVRVARHLRHYHHIQSSSAGRAFCGWDNCTHRKPMKRENLPRHVVMHLGVKWRCHHCMEMFSRDDAVQRHIERVRPQGEADPAIEVIPGREGRTLGYLQAGQRTA